MDYLFEFCVTDRQREVLQAVIDNGGMRPAARALNCNAKVVDRILSTLKKRAASKGVAPDRGLNHQLPDGFSVRGVSSYYNKDGVLSGQWVKSQVDAERQAELMREVIDALKEDLPKYDAITCQGGGNADLLNVYVVTDFHLGMYAWHQETGADWNLEIAENLLVNWFATAIAHAPMSESAILANLGDMLHWDGMEAVTPAHRHILDADTRFQKLVRVAIRVIRKIISMLLKKHRRVHVLMADANHDPASGAWLRELLASVYEEEPRITVDTTADTYYCYEHGETAIFMHHGHKRGVDAVDRVFAAKYRQVFGRTKYAYAHLGHLHSNEVKESQLMIVERHRTLAAPDAYAAKGGWISGRDAKVITYSKRFGEVSRLTINPEMVSCELIAP